MEGQLSGLSSLEVGRRLETPNVLGDMTVHGTFAPGNSPADSIVNGALTLAADGTLEMELSGYGLGTDYDRLTVTDLPLLDGTLDIVNLDGFTIDYGDSFDVFNWDGGVSGEFASISTSALTGTLEWDTSELYTTGTLSVIPEPATLSLLGFSTLGLLFRRRKMNQYLLTGVISRRDSFELASGKQAEKSAGYVNTIRPYMNAKAGAKERDLTIRLNY